MYHGVLIPFQAASQKLCSVIYRNNLFSLHENHIKSGRVHHIQHSNYASYMWSSLALWKTLCIKIGYNVCFKKPKKKVILFVICTCTMLTILGFRRADSTEPNFSKELWKSYLDVFLEIRSKVWQYWSVAQFLLFQTLFVNQSVLLHPRENQSQINLVKVS